MFDSSQWMSVSGDECSWLVSGGTKRIRRAATDLFSLAGCRPVLIEFDTGGFVPTAFPASHMAVPESVRGAVPKRQAEYFYGRAAARIAMANHAPPFVTVGTGSMREPLWPEGLVGSISHCQGLAVAVVMPAARCNGIGIDAEDIPSGHALKAIGRIALSPAEVALLHRGGMDPAIAFALAFSAKESVFKGAFANVGRFFDFSAVRIRAVDPSRHVLRMQVEEALSDRFRLGDWLDIHYGTLPGGRVVTCFHY